MMFSRKKIRVGSDRGYTIIEFLVVIIVTSVLAGLFSETLVSSISMYTSHNLRKTAQIDSRRSSDMLMHDLREWRSWQNAPTSTSLDFQKSKKYEVSFLWFTRQYYDDMRVGFDYTGGQLVYSRDNDGNWSNDYLLIGEGISGGSQFSVTSAGGTDRITVEMVMTVNNKPLELRTTVFPRQQGG